MDQLALLHSLRKFAAETATKANPEKWEQAKRDAVASMGGKHSARAMQQAVRLYKERGGEYKGKKPSSSENSLKKWTKQEWQTRPGTPEKAKRSDGSTSRYLPKEKWESLSKSEQVATDKKKLRSDEQYVSNTRAAKVKGDADYYDKKASLLRLKTALHKQALLEHILHLANPGTRAAAGLALGKASGGAQRAVQKAAPVVKGVIPGVQLRAYNNALNLNIDRAMGLGGTPGGVVANLAANSIIPAIPEVAKSLGKAKPSEFLQKLDKVRTMNNNPAAEFSRRLLGSVWQ